jgi:hypothetical protein
VKKGGRKVHSDYRLELIEKIIEKYHPQVISPKAGRPPSGPHPRWLTERLFPEFILGMGKKQNPTRECVVCTRKRDSSGKPLRKETRYICKSCDAPLCVTPCFEKYHTKVNF